MQVWPASSVEADYGFRALVLWYNNIKRLNSIWQHLIQHFFIIQIHFSLTK
jgi:hypothetical protein